VDNYGDMLITDVL